MVIEYAKIVVLGLLVASVVGYVIALGCYLLGATTGIKMLKKAVSFFDDRDGSYVFGLPISAATAFGIVMAFDAVSPFEKADNTLSFEAFNAKFSGPAAPATIWIVCYLTLVVSMRIAPNLSGNRASEPPENPAPEVPPPDEAQSDRDKGRGRPPKQSRASRKPRRR